ncbi:MAG: helix-turn-helix transcriptional regulator [Ruminococcaceae bacterium]|nr:helix-turn-helix transcriptional regulator [Oscillospiraceae bacterium]
MKVETYTQTREQSSKIGERLKLIRTANELSHEEFASRICTHPFDYSRVEKGIETFSGAMLKLISYEFGVSLSWIMRGVPTAEDPEYCQPDKNGQHIFNSCIAVQEAICEYTTDNGADMWSNAVENTIDSILGSIKYICSDITSDAEYKLDSDIRDVISLANYDGYTAGWRAATQLIRTMLNANGIPETPPAPQKTASILSPTIVTEARGTVTRVRAHIVPRTT